MSFVGTRPEVVKYVKKYKPEYLATLLFQKIYQADPMVKDVCAECNNQRISYIDSYPFDPFALQKALYDERSCNKIYTVWIMQ